MTLSRVPTTTKRIQHSMTSDMLSPQYRSRYHPKLPDLFERLHAQNWEPKTLDTIEGWLVETASATVTPPPGPTHRMCEAPNPAPLTTQAISPIRPPLSSTIRPSRIHSLTPKPLPLLPLQATHGNRAPLPPRASRKRKMPEAFNNEEPRHSARLKKMTPPESVGDGLRAKDKKSGPGARGRKMRKPTKDLEAEGVKEKKALITPRHSESEAFASSEETNGNVAHTVQRGIFVEAATSHTLSRSSGRSPSKKSGSPSKASRNLNRRERMQFLTPRISFTTLIATKNKGYLTGRLQTLWLHYISWDDQGIIPTEFKVSNRETKCDHGVANSSHPQEAMRKESDTPNKTRAPVPDHCFGTNRYAEEDYNLIKATITDVLSMADKYRHSGCTEAHWVSFVVNPLLSLVRRLRRYQKEGSKIAVVDL